MKSVFMVYWSEMANAELVPHSKSFPADGLTQALSFVETLRRSQANGGPIRFVTLCSENPDAVGKAGAADPPPDYAWKKRRP